jgi:protein AbiQ
MYNQYNYFIPLTSAKEKHKKLKNTGKYYMLVQETLKRKKINDSKDIYKVINKDTLGNYKNDDVKKIYSLIDFRKAIPVPDGFYSRIKIKGHKNQDLLQKEFDICLSKKDKIISKAISTIHEQHTTHVIQKAQCDYLKLENVCDNYTN